MKQLAHDDPRAIALVSAIRRGDVAAVQRQLVDDPSLVSARIGDAQGASRSLLHIVADWPGHVPHGAALVTILVRAGADPDAPMIHARPTGAPETPLHWAASSDDVAVLDALLDHGANIEAPGAVHTGGTAMSDAVVFAQWNAARRLLERGAATTIWQAAALGLMDRVEAACTGTPTPTARDVTNAFWHACRGGQRATAELLLSRGADLHWVGYDRRTPIDVAQESGDVTLVAWLVAQGAARASGGQR